MQNITILLNHKNVERLRSDRGAFNNKVCLALTGKKITEVRTGWVDRVKNSGMRMDLETYKALIEQRNDKWNKKSPKTPENQLEFDVIKANPKPWRETPYY